jgi:hypothetical protein
MTRRCLCRALLRGRKSEVLSSRARAMVNHLYIRVRMRNRACDMHEKLHQDRGQVHGLIVIADSLHIAAECTFL